MICSVIFLSHPQLSIWIETVIIILIIHIWNNVYMCVFLQNWLKRHLESRFKQNLRNCVPDTAKFHSCDEWYAFLKMESCRFDFGMILYWLLKLRVITKITKILWRIKSYLLDISHTRWKNQTIWKCLHKPPRSFQLHK